MGLEPTMAKPHDPKSCPYSYSGTGDFDWASWRNLTTSYRKFIKLFAVLRGLEPRSWQWQCRIVASSTIAPIWFCSPESRPLSLFILTELTAWPLNDEFSRAGVEELESPTLALTVQRSTDWAILPNVFCWADGRIRTDVAQESILITSQAESTNCPTSADNSEK